MALKLLIENKVGVTTEYHRIIGLETNNKIKLTILSYTNETYRNLEKDTNSVQQELEGVVAQLDAELSKPETERDLVLILSLTDTNNTLVKKLHEPDTQYGVYTTEYEFPKSAITDISFTDLYTLLKTLDAFKDALDV